MVIPKFGSTNNCFFTFVNVLWLSSDAIVTATLKLWCRTQTNEMKKKTHTHLQFFGITKYINKFQLQTLCKRNLCFIWYCITYLPYFIPWLVYPLCVGICKILFNRIKFLSFFALTFFFLTRNWSRAQPHCFLRIFFWLVFHLTICNLILLEFIKFILNMIFTCEHLIFSK